MLENMRRAGIIPVIKIEDAQKAQPLAEALSEGGLDCIEITFRTAAAAKAIENIAKNCKNVCVGAGTVLSTEQAQRALDAGAQFIVSPGSNDKVIEYVLKKGVPMVPGVITPTEIENVLSFGLSVMKFFPAESFGGVKTLKSLSAPYANVEWIPTGGINQNNIGDYFSFKKVLACGASCVATDEMIAAGRFDEIKAKALEFTALKNKYRGEKL